jgi:hypothetical protein
MQQQFLINVLGFGIMMPGNIAAQASVACLA